MVLLLSSCEVYTLENTLEEAIWSNYTRVSPGQCAEFLSLFLGRAGDFPLKIRLQNEKRLPSVQDPNILEFKPNHYRVLEEGVISVEEACNPKDFEVHQAKPDFTPALPNTQEKEQEENPEANPIKTQPPTPHQGLEPQPKSTQQSLERNETIEE